MKGCFFLMNNQFNAEFDFEMMGKTLIRKTEIFL
jgi:hypothetical protein